jgi:hypothetical protein
MLDHSKILVWYEVSSQRVSLGEVMCNRGRGLNLAELWRDTPAELIPISGLGYWMSLIGDNGRMIADKPISMSSVDKVLLVGG